MSKNIDQSTIAETQEVQADGTTKAKAAKAATPMYRGPNGETWSGRGTTPQWILDTAAKKAGGSGK